jgi:hypothetical protein
VQAFITMGVTPPARTEWIADSRASFHTTLDLLFAPHILLTLLRSWLVMDLAFPSPPWVLLLVPFVFPMFSLLL